MLEKTEVVQKRCSRHRHHPVTARSWQLGLLAMCREIAPSKPFVKTDGQWDAGAAALRSEAGYPTYRPLPMWAKRR